MVKPATKEKIKLQVEKRKVIGRKVKELRREGILPANVYGKKIKSLAVQIELKSFLPVFKQVGETGVVNLNVRGETKIRPVLIHNIQLHPATDQPLHADFYQVDLKTKVTTSVPIELAGESIAVKEKSGVLIQPLSEIEVEALPSDLPDRFEIDLGQLEEIGDVIKVESLELPKGVKILTAAGEILAKIEPPTKEEEVKPPAKEEAPVEGEAEEEKPAEGKEKKPEEKKSTEESRPARPEPGRGEPAEGKGRKKEKK